MSSFIFFLMIRLPLISTLFPYTSLFRSDRKSTLFFFLRIRRPPRFTLFPSTTLFRSDLECLTIPRTRSGSAYRIHNVRRVIRKRPVQPEQRGGEVNPPYPQLIAYLAFFTPIRRINLDRKSTRLNSSHT